jgi:hypothetical protein
MMAVLAWGPRQQPPSPWLAVAHNPRATVVNTAMSSDPLVIEAAHGLIILGGHQEDQHKNVAGITTMPPSDDGPSPSSAPLVAKDDNSSSSLVPYAAAANKVKNQSIAKQPPSSVPLAVVVKNVVLRTTNELAFRYGYCLGLKIRHCDQENGFLP